MIDKEAARCSTVERAIAAPIVALGQATGA